MSNSGVHPAFGVRLANIAGCPYRKCRIKVVAECFARSCPTREERATGEGQWVRYEAWHQAVNYAFLRVHLFVMSLLAHEEQLEAL